jgi:Arc/MetJ-type ribon-helix-helix transcriptional regulator
MGRIKPRGRYMAISVPMEMHKEITEFVEKSSYNSIAEFVKEAIREKMNKEYKIKYYKLEKEVASIKKLLKENKLLLSGGKQYG